MSVSVVAVLLLLLALSSSVWAQLFTIATDGNSNAQLALVDPTAGTLKAIGRWQTKVLGLYGMAVNQSNVIFSGSTTTTGRSFIAIARTSDGAIVLQSLAPNDIEIASFVYDNNTNVAYVVVVNATSFDRHVFSVSNGVFVHRMALPQAVDAASMTYSSAQGVIFMSALSPMGGSGVYVVDVHTFTGQVVDVGDLNLSLMDLVWNENSQQLYGWFQNVSVVQDTVLFAEIGAAGSVATPICVITGVICDPPFSQDTQSVFSASASTLYASLYDANSNPLFASVNVKSGAYSVVAVSNKWPVYSAFAYL